jgi:hypothetical protein
MSDGALCYSDLLALYKGKATIVEALPDETLAAIAIDTPLTEFIRAADASGTPKHVILTGGAGDGKSFAIRRAAPKDFDIILDASAAASPESTAPIDDLVGRLKSTLDGGRRLLIAINRGQFERLDAAVQRIGDEPLKSLLAEARVQSRLNETWASAPDLIGLIDVGLFASSNRRVLDAMLDRVTGAVPDLNMSPAASSAFSAARDALKKQRVRNAVYAVARLAHTRGHHPTMRQLWSFVAFLATGARSSSSLAPVSLVDAVGARLFDHQAEGPLFALAREHLDPVFYPNPDLTRAALLGELAASLRAENPELAGLVPPPDVVESGDVLTRIAAVHGHPLARGIPFDPDAYTKVVEMLLRHPPGWTTANDVTLKLLKGIYDGLGLWAAGNSFPAWQRLCFDSSKLSDAAAIATTEVSSRALRLALPRPNPWAAKAFADDWMPPYLWLGAGDGHGAQERARLRLSPQLFNRLFDYERHGQHGRADLLVLQRWLAQVPEEVPLQTAIRVFQKDRKEPLSISSDPLDAHLALHWESDQ